MQKWGPLKVLTPVKGALKKKLTQMFQENWVYMGFYGGFLVYPYLAKRWALKFFVVWKGSQKCLWLFVICVRSPLQVFVNGPLHACLTVIFFGLNFWCKILTRVHLLLFSFHRFLLFKTSQIFLVAFWLFCTRGKWYILKKFLSFFFTV